MRYKSEGLLFTATGERYMEPIPLPSHIHYELLLQLLERQTMFAVSQQPHQREQVQQLIITLRKAMSQQKHLEETCDRLRVPVEYRWSLNRVDVPEGAIKIPTEVKNSGCL